MTEMNFRRISIHSLDSSHLCRPSPPSCHWLLRSDLQEPGWGTPLSSGGSRPANPLLRCQGGERKSQSPWPMASSHRVQQGSRCAGRWARLAGASAFSREAENLGFQAKLCSLQCGQSSKEVKARRHAKPSDTFAVCGLQVGAAALAPGLGG